MDHLERSIADLVRAAIDEDVGPGDITSLACLEPKPVRATITAKSRGAVSGLVPAALVFAMVDPAIRFEPVMADGSLFEPGHVVVGISGRNQTLLTAERTALNFMAHLSGVATLTAEFVRRVQGTRCHILDTRKTTPGWRLLEKQAVLHGGGYNHRLGLYDMMLIKDNHIAAAGSIAAAVEAAHNYLESTDCRQRFGLNAESVAIEVEVTSTEQVRQALSAGVRRLLLDNQTPASLKQLVRTARDIDDSVKLEASGNVSLDNVAALAATGVDYISIGALTHSAPACDFSLNIDV
ncbi:MAG: carboxylating nicotinate-nucleotide diphosphorylase [bacterium]